MANYIASDTDLTAVANAIRTKGGTSAELAFPNGFVSAVQAIPSGGGGSTTVTVSTAVSTVTGCYNALKDACIAAVGDVPFIARYKSGNVPNYCLYELRYTPEDITDYFQTPTESTGTGAYVQMVRAPYNGYFDYHIHLRETKLANSYSYNIDANTVYEVLVISALYEGVNV